MRTVLSICAQGHLLSFVCSVAVTSRPVLPRSSVALVFRAPRVDGCTHTCIRVASAPARRGGVSCSNVKIQRTRAGVCRRCCRVAAPVLVWVNKHLMRPHPALPTYDRVRGRAARTGRLCSSLSTPMVAFSFCFSCLGRVSLRAGSPLGCIATFVKVCVCGTRRGEGRREGVQHVYITFAPCGVVPPFPHSIPR